MIEHVCMPTFVVTTLLHEDSLGGGRVPTRDFVSFGRRQGWDVFFGMIGFASQKKNARNFYRTSFVVQRSALQVTLFPVHDQYEVTRDLFCRSGRADIALTSRTA